MQGMLFAGLDDDPAEQPAAAGGRLQVCALNVGNPSPPRAQQLLTWLTGTRRNALVLTELRPADGCRLLISGLAAAGYDTHLPARWGDSQHFTLLATRDLDHHQLDTAFDPRTVAVDLTGTTGTARLVGLYGPTNGMTPGSSDRRRVFQKQFLDHLAAIWRTDLVLAGDLNVVEPGHQPHLPTFQDHDYGFYTGLLEAGLYDAFRTLHPGQTAHSWLSDRFGAQRLDHILAAPGAGTLTECDYDHTPRTLGYTDHAAHLATLIWQQR
jgi:exonuclease III